MSATSPGGRDEGLLVPAVPAEKSPSGRPEEQAEPPSKAIRDRTLHTSVSAVASLPTSGSGGQLLVYE